MLIWEVKTRGLLCMWDFLAAGLSLTLLLLLRTPRKTTKESLAQASSGITESLMGISRMMSQQVQQSEEAMQTLGTARPGAGRVARGWAAEFQARCCRGLLPLCLPPRLPDFCGGWFSPEQDVLLLPLPSFCGCAPPSEGFPAAALPGARGQNDGPAVWAAASGAGGGVCSSLRALGTSQAAIWDPLSREMGWGFQAHAPVRCLL